MILRFLDGREIDIEHYGLGVEDYSIPSLEIEHVLQQIDGRASPIIIDSHLKGRTIPVQFAYKSYDWHDIDLQRAEINALFARPEAYYIIFKDAPYKRWLVKTANGFVMDKELDILGSISIDFLCVQPFAESVGTCLDLVNRDFDSGLWGWGSGIDVDREYQYEFTTNSFVVANIGTATINPIEHALKITVRGDFPNGMTLRNATTGDIYQYNEPLTASETLVIDRLRTFVNGISRFGDTNKRHIILAPNEFGSGGDNQIILEGGTVNSVVFEFRFMYK